ncbi:MAG: GNAT family N-acetyltransferase [Planctomycetes bacterium]|nr:GNAT family N-acetyltransferase [Planctomycetota bacterium]
MRNIQIALRKFEDSDTDELLSHIDSPELLFLWSGMTFTFPAHKAHFLKVIHNLPYAYIFKIINEETRETIGYVELNIDTSMYKPKPESAKIGRLLIFKSNMRGKGLGQRILHMLLDLAFIELELKTVTLKVITFNKIGIACYEKAGFETDKIVKDNNKNYDYLMMSMNSDKFNKMTKKCEKI